MKFILLLAILVPSLTLACNVKFNSESLCMNIKWENFPKARTNGTVLLQFFDPRDPARFINPKFTPKMVLWMTSMGHGSNPVTLTKIDEGQFKSTNVNFIMAGPWDIKYQLLDGDKIVETQTQSVKVQ